MPVENKKMEVAKMRMTVSNIKEMENKFKGEWVFLQNCKFDKIGNLKLAKLIFHSYNRDEVYRKLKDYKNYRGKCAIKYFGEIPKDLTVVL